MTGNYWEPSLRAPPRLHLGNMPVDEPAARFEHESPCRIENLRSTKLAHRRWLASAISVRPCWIPAMLTKSRAPSCTKTAARWITCQDQANPAGLRQNDSNSQPSIPGLRAAVTHYILWNLYTLPAVMYNSTFTIHGKGNRCFTERPLSDAYSNSAWVRPVPAWRPDASTVDVGNRGFGQASTRPTTVELAVSSPLALQKLPPRLGELRVLAAFALRLFELETHMERLTWRQQEILDFVRESIFDRGRPPTVREIADHFHMRSPHAAHGHLIRLERKGYIERDRGIARGIRLAGRFQKLGILKLAGRVHAGPPLEAIEQPGDVDLHVLFGEPECLSVALVLDDSLLNYRIVAGDHLILRGEAIVGVVRRS